MDPKRVGPPGPVQVEDGAPGPDQVEDGASWTQSGKRVGPPGPAEVKGGASWTQSGRGWGPVADLGEGFRGSEPPPQIWK